MSDTKRPSREHAAEVLTEMLEEITASRSIATPKYVPPSGSGPVRTRTWHLVTTALAAVLTACVLLGSLGRAFFATREEYTAAESTNAVEHEALRQTLNSVNRTLEEQNRVLQEMSRALQAQAVELATIKPRK